MVFQIRGISIQGISVTSFVEQLVYYHVERDKKVNLILENAGYHRTNRVPVPHR